MPALLVCTWNGHIIEGEPLVIHASIALYPVISKIWKYTSCIVQSRRKIWRWEGYIIEKVPQVVHVSVQENLGKRNEEIEDQPHLATTIMTSKIKSNYQIEDQIHWRGQNLEDPEFFLKSSLSLLVLKVGSSTPLSLFLVSLSLSVYHLMRRRWPWKLVGNKYTKISN